jgi:hypothetical protein
MNDWRIKWIILIKNPTFWIKYVRNVNIIIIFFKKKHNKFVKVNIYKFKILKKKK